MSKGVRTPPVPKVVPAAPSLLATGGLQSARVLVVEDEELVALTIVAALTRIANGSSGNGAESVRAAELWRYAAEVTSTVRNASVPRSAGAASHSSATRATSSSSRGSRARRFSSTTPPSSVPRTLPTVTPGARAKASLSAQAAPDSV